MHASTHANAHTFAHTYTHVEMAGAQRHVPPVSKRHDILALERKLVQRNDFMWVQLRLIQFVWLFCPKSALSLMRHIRNHGQTSNHMNAFVPRKNASTHDMASCVEAFQASHMIWLADMIWPSSLERSQFTARMFKLHTWYGLKLEHSGCKLASCFICGCMSHDLTDGMGLCACACACRVCVCVDCNVCVCVCVDCNVCVCVCVFGL